MSTLNHDAHADDTVNIRATRSGQSGCADGATQHCGRDPVDATGWAGLGTAGWEDAVRWQRWAATPTRPEFLGLAGEMTATLATVDDLVSVLVWQVARYDDTERTRGRQVFDDTGQVRPRARLVAAGDALEDLRTALADAGRAADTFRGLIGHLGSQPASRDPEPESVPTERASGEAVSGEDGVDR